MPLIDTSELMTMKQWALCNVFQFWPNGPSRQYGDLEYLSAPTVWRDIKQRVIQQYQIIDWILEPIYRDLCGFTTDGGFVHTHRDKTQPGRDHIRVNLVISKPDSGGDPILDGITIPLPEIGGSWRCDAGGTNHGCTPVHGSVPRIILSFGFLVPIEYRHVEY